jgi:hypothetical protein
MNTNTLHRARGGGHVEMGRSSNNSSGSGSYAAHSWCPGDGRRVVVVGVDHTRGVASDGHRQ